MTDDIVTRLREGKGNKMSSDLKTQILEAVEALKKQSDEYWADPASKTCGVGFPHTVGGNIIKVVDVGQFMVCIECGQALEIPNV